MNSIDRLKEISKLNNGLILTKDAVKNGVSRTSLTNLCKDGRISRIAIGQYVLADNLNDEMMSLSTRSSYIIFSHESALFLNGISERTPFEHTVTIPSSKTLSRSISSECKIYYIKDEFFELGKTKLQTTMGNLVPTYDIDRTVCDIIRSRNRLDDETFLSAIKNYVSSSRKNLTNLSIYAEKMNMVQTVRKYMEMLL